MAIACGSRGTPFVSLAGTADDTPPATTGRLELELAAAGYVAIGHADIDGLRRKAPAVAGRELAPGFLKPVDEQTVCVYCATAQAMHDAALDGGSFKEWGVVAAPRFLGRVYDAGTFHKFLQIGGGAVSVHLIPQQSQHAVSGAISVAFGMQGPNFGVGCGVGSAAEGLITAFSAYDPSVVPGLWLLLSEFDPEARPDRAGKHTTPAVCHALALALTHRPSAGPRLSLAWSGDRAVNNSTATPITVAELAGPITAAARGVCRDRHTWQLDGGFQLELARPSSTALAVGDC